MTAANRRLFLATGAVLAALSCPAAAQERCNPPHVMCGEGDRTFRCEPCPRPGVIRFQQFGEGQVTANDLRELSQSLDSYRQYVESAELTPEAREAARQRLRQREALLRSVTRYVEAGR